MDSVLFLTVPILTSGIAVMLYSPGRRHRIHRYDGQLLYLKAIGWGGICTFSAAFITAIIGHFLFDLKFNVLACMGNMHLYVDFVILSPLFSLWEASSCLNISGVSVDIPYYLKFVTSNSFFSFLKSHGDKFIFLGVCTLISYVIAAGIILKNKRSIQKQAKKSNLSQTESLAALIASISADLPIDELINRSLLGEEPVFVILENRKAYVGFVTSISGANESLPNGHEFGLTPLLSGYRDSNSLKVHFTTFYDDYNSNFEIILQRSKVFSITRFCPKRFIALNS